MSRTQTFWLLILAAGMALSRSTSNAEEDRLSPGDQNLVPLAVELPEASFGGEPVDYWSPNLEDLSFQEPPPFYVPKGTANVAAGKCVTSSIAPVHGELKQLTDGVKDYGRANVVELPGGLQWVQVDLGQEYAIYAILLWHFHERIHAYHDVIVQVSNDKEFQEGVVTVYNNDDDNSAGYGIGKDKEYFDRNRGRLIDAKGSGGRYVRCYSQGNSRNAFNHYIEIEVHGLPEAGDITHSEGETGNPVNPEVVPLKIILPEPAFS